MVVFLCPLFPRFVWMKMDAKRPVKMVIFMAVVSDYFFILESGEAVLCHKILL